MAAAKPNGHLSPFERFVQKIAQVPKAEADAVEAAEREKRVHGSKPQTKGAK